MTSSLRTTKVKPNFFQRIKNNYVQFWRDDFFRGIFFGMLLSVFLLGLLILTKLIWKLIQ